MVETVPQLTSSDPIPDIVAALEGSGVVRVDDMLDADVLARFNTELDEHLAAADPGRSLPAPTSAGPSPLAALEG